MEKNINVKDIVLSLPLTKDYIILEKIGKEGDYSLKYKITTREGKYILKLIRSPINKNVNEFLNSCKLAHAEILTTGEWRGFSYALYEFIEGDSLIVAFDYLKENEVYSLAYKVGQCLKVLKDNNPTKPTNRIELDQLQKSITFKANDFELFTKLDYFSESDRKILKEMKEWLLNNFEMLNCENFYSITDISPKAFIYKQNSLVMVECETIWYASLFNLLNCFFFENENNIEKHIAFVNGILDGMTIEESKRQVVFYAFVYASLRNITDRLKTGSKESVNALLEKLKGVTLFNKSITELVTS